MTYKISCEGRIDLIVGEPCKGHMRTHHASVQLLMTSSYDLCLVYRQMDGRTDGRTDGRRTRPEEISTAELKALSCAKTVILLRPPLSLLALPLGPLAKVTIAPGLFF